MVEYRARFDTNKNLQDLMKAKRLLISGKEEIDVLAYRKLQLYLSDKIKEKVSISNPRITLRYY
jgi:hypothetical protein